MPSPRLPEQAQGRRKAKKEGLERRRKAPFPHDIPLSPKSGRRKGSRDKERGKSNTLDNTVKLVCCGKVGVFLPCPERIEPFR